MQCNSWTPVMPLFLTKLHSLCWCSVWLSFWLYLYDLRLCKYNLISLHCLKFTCVLSSSLFSCTSLICFSILFLLTHQSWSDQFWPRYSHLLVNELQSSINSHHSFRLILLEQDWSHQFVDVRIIFQTGKFLQLLAPHTSFQILASNLLDTLILLLLRLELLPRVDTVL